ncbi:MAG: anthranilate phosphoribosyltransferase, partial [Oceanospirillaceae bacterium]
MQEHPFAQYVRILGKGKKGSRSLTFEEARDAMGLILDDKVRAEQLGAFLMLLRVKEESPEELAGFVTAVRARNPAPSNIAVSLDWSTYAGKKRQLPWFLLTALLLAENGHRVFMHGAKGHTAGRIYIQDVLTLFSIASCADWSQVSAQLDTHNFAFMGINTLAPKVGDI